MKKIVILAAAFTLTSDEVMFLNQFPVHPKIEKFSSPDMRRLNAIFYKYFSGFQAQVQTSLLKKARKAKHTDNSSYREVDGQLVLLDFLKEISDLQNGLKAMPEIFAINGIPAHRILEAINFPGRGELYAELLPLVLSTEIVHLDDVHSFWRRHLGRLNHAVADAEYEDGTKFNDFVEEEMNDLREELIRHAEDIYHLRTGKSLSRELAGKVADSLADEKIVSKDHTSSLIGSAIQAIIEGEAPQTPQFIQPSANRDELVALIEQRASMKSISLEGQPVDDVILEIAGRTISTRQDEIVLIDAAIDKLHPAHVGLGSSVPNDEISDQERYEADHEAEVKGLTEVVKNRAHERAIIITDDQARHIVDTLMNAMVNGEEHEKQIIDFKLDELMPIVKGDEKFAEAPAVSEEPVQFPVLNGYDLYAVKDLISGTYAEVTAQPFATKADVDDTLALLDLRPAGADGDAAKQIVRDTVLRMIELRDAKA